MVRTITRIRLLTFAACAALVLSSSVAHGKPRSPEASGAALELCMLSGDARMLENSTHFGCCSKDAGICVVCPKPPSAGNRCEVIAHRTKLPGMNFAPMPEGAFSTMQ